MPCPPDQPLLDLKNPYLQAQPALGHHAVLAVQVLDLLTVQVCLLLD
jgi:hypothetical protein